jgi:hypothetical protein
VVARYRSIPESESLMTPITTTATDSTGIIRPVDGQITLYDYVGPLPIAVVRDMTDDHDTSTGSVSHERLAAVIAGWVSTQPDGPLLRPVLEAIEAVDQEVERHAVSRRHIDDYCHDVRTYMRDRLAA